MIKYGNNSTIMLRPTKRPTSAMHKSAQRSCAPFRAKRRFWTTINQETLMRTTLFLSAITAGLLATSTMGFAQNRVVQAQYRGDADRAQQGSNYLGPTDSYDSAVPPRQENREFDPPPGYRTNQSVDGPLYYDRRLNNGTGTIPDADRDPHDDR
jgi:hypothetical protein